MSKRSRPMPLPDPAVSAAQSSLASLLMQEVVSRSVAAPEPAVAAPVVETARKQPPAVTPEPEAVEATDSELDGLTVQDSTWGEWEAALDEQDASSGHASRPASLRRR